MFQHPCNNPSQPNDYLKKLHEDTEDELQCYLQEDISTAQWTAFETCINKLSKKLSNLNSNIQIHPVTTTKDNVSFKDKTKSATTIDTGLQDTNVT